jgi:hypothetical protein
MRPLRAVFIYIMVVFVLGALLAPWVYWLAQWAAQEVPFLSGLAKAPFHRYVNQCLKVLAVAGLWPFLRSLDVKSWASVGLVKPAGQWKKLGGGFALGFGSMALVAAAALCAGAVKFHGGVAGSWWGKLPGIAATACIVAVLEELLFRGALFGSLRRVHPWPAALLFSSAIYAILHFFQRVKSPAEISWRSGLEILPRMMTGFVDWQLLIPGFLVLMLAGVVLALGFQRTGNLYFSIGLHAGWIFWLKSYTVITDPTAAGKANEWFWGTGKLYDGWMALIAVTAAFLVVRRLPLKPPLNSHGSADSFETEDWRRSRA